jgi:hypothetical protein
VARRIAFIYDINRENKVNKRDDQKCEEKGRNEVDA